MTGVDYIKSKEERERTIFQVFVKAAQLSVIPNSISSQPTPAPDILCEIQGRGLVAFELVEIVTPAIVREMLNSQKLEKAFETACEIQPEMRLKYRDALIHVGFLKTIPIKQRLSVVPEVVKKLLQYSENTVGYIQVPHSLRKVLSMIEVHRVVLDGPAFNLMDMTKHTEEIFWQIEKKCKNTYLGKPPVELLAYYITQPSSDSFDWQSEFHDYVLKILSNSPFERVWVYDNWSKTIKYVHPVPEG